MKRKIKITSKQVKRVVLIVLLVAVVGLLTYLTIDSFKADRVSSNSTAPNEIVVSGTYATYLDEHEEKYPSGYKFSVKNNNAYVAEFDDAETTAINKAHPDFLDNSGNPSDLTLASDFKTGQAGSVEDCHGNILNFIYSGKKGSVVYKVDVEEEGFYNIVVDYVAVDKWEATEWEASGGANIERKIQIKGVGETEYAKPFDDLRNVSFTRTWHDDGEPLTDLSGNQIKPSQAELIEENYEYVRDSIGYVTEPFLVYFKAGTSYIEFSAIKENMGIINVFVASKETYISYEEYIAKYSDSDKVTGKVSYKVEGEEAYSRSSSTIYAVNDKTNANTTTASGEKTSPVKLILNTIGGSKWTNPGSWISWKIKVDQAGLYNISLRAKQNVSRGLFSTRKLYIDNEVPFNEAQNCKFVYDSNYEIVTLGSADENYFFYLTEGEHTIRMECTLGDYASEINRIQDVIDDLNALYREIIKRTGISPDPYIDYFAKNEGKAFIQRAVSEFSRCIDILYDVSANIQEISGEKSSETTSLETMAVQLKQFVKNYRKIQKSLSDFSTNISSLGTWILDVSEQALTVDYILVHSDDYKLPKANPNIFVGSWFAIRGFFGSFFFDYESVGLTQGNEGWEDVEVWLLTSSSTGREQANAISSMIYEAQNEAIQKNDTTNLLYGLNIRLKVVSSGVLLTATLAKRGPDVAINVDNGLPVNYALRGAIHDLSGFDDFDEVCEQFKSSAITPYKYVDAQGHEGCYALPYTQSFLVMFYRTDMFKEYGWTVPETWDQVLLLIPELQIMNFQFYLPLNQAGASSVVNQIFASYLYQTIEDPSEAFYRTTDYYIDGVKRQYVESNFDSEDSMKAFEFWCSFYSDYSFPLSASFINRFRSGETPIGIAGYDTYNTLAVSAPEIRGKWAFSLLPGVEKVDENGDSYIDYMGAASGSALVMMEQADNYENSWKFMKWFISKDTQVGYAREVESILGSAARLNTANVAAFENLAWTQDELSILLKQWDKTIGVPEVPGGYYTGRNLENAFRYVVNNNQNPRQTLSDYIRQINSEINRKRDEFHLGTEKEYTAQMEKENKENGGK